MNCRSSLALLPAVAGVLWLAPLVPAQRPGALETWHSVFGAADKDKFGSAVAGVGDVTGDGVPDFLVGAPYFDGAYVNTGAAYVYSGADGATVYSFQGTGLGDLFGSAVAGAGDVNADGTPDFLVGAPWRDVNGITLAGSAYVYSGANGNLLLQVDGGGSDYLCGTAVAGAGDVDGDGYDDLLIGSPGATNASGDADAGQVLVVSGSTGGVLFVLQGRAAGARLGTSVASLGDLDADGVPEILVGVPGVGAAGEVEVHSGRTGALLYRLAGMVAGESFGSAVADAGLLDGDGYPDIVVGAPLAPGPMHANVGAAYFFSGASGALLHRYLGEVENGLFGSEVARLGDIDGDGWNEVAVSAPELKRWKLWWGHVGAVYVFSARDGQVKLKAIGEYAGYKYGSAVASLGDVSGDGLPEFLVGAKGGASSPSSAAKPGACYVLGYLPCIWTNLDQMSAASGGTLAIKLDFPRLASGEDYAILLSAHGTGPTFVRQFEIPLTWDFLFERTRQGDYSMLPLSAGMTGVLDPNGDARATITMLPGSMTKTVGRAFYMAAIAMHQGQPGYWKKPIFISEARAVTILP